MIIETGIVKKLKDGKAIIEIEKNSACSGCHAGCACDIDKSVMIIEANDPFGVAEDQCVELSIPNSSALQAAFIVYVIPLIALIFGTLAGKYFGIMFEIENGPEILGGFGCLGLSLLFVKYYDAIFRQKLENQPVITKVIG